MIQALFLIAGLIIGVVQFLLLGRITAALLEKKRHMAVYIAAKLALYIIFILLIFFFMPYFLYTAAGYGVGIIAGSFLNFAIRR
ncbi:MAG: hypothetical protein E7588_03635 [Ruminococcaceae bacterium]|nr:hypothetical protein [Oscillospiraceae bacterium]